MSRDAIALADVREATIEILCELSEPCGRRGRYSIERLIAAHSADVGLRDGPETLAAD